VYIELEHMLVHSNTRSCESSIKVPQDQTFSFGTDPLCS